MDASDSPPPRRPRPPAQSTLIREIRQISDAQDQLVTHAQLRALGMDRRRIARWVEVELLRRIHRRVYAFDEVVPNQRMRNRSALLSTPGVVHLSHQTAATALGLASFPASPVHVTTTGWPRPQPGIQTHHTPGLERFERTTIHERPGTSAARTLFDLAEDVGQDQLDSMVDRAVHLRLYDQNALDHVIDARPTMPQAELLRAALNRLDATSGHNRSELERLLIRLINDSHLPAAANNARIAGREVDVHFPGTRAIIEADGRDFHSSPAQIAADLAKQRELEAFGFVFMFVTWRQARYEPERTLERAERFVEANREPPQPGPPPLDL